MSEDERELVNIILFSKGKGAVCKDCDIVKSHIHKIVDTIKKNALIAVQFKTVGLSENPEMAEIYSIRNVPAVLYNGEVVMEAEEVAIFTAGGTGGGFGQASGGFEMAGEMNGFQSNDTGMDMFGQKSGTATSTQEIFNHLFEKLINAGITASVEKTKRENWQKYNLLAISEQSRFLEDEHIANIRKTIGDYVHIGVLQSIAISILSINPNSKKYLFKAGSLMGYFGNDQFRLIQANPRIVDVHDPDSKFKEVMKGLEKLFTEDYTGLPLFLSRKAKMKVVSIKRNEAQLRIFDSAFASGTKTGQPVCYLIAGLLSGLLEVTLGYESVKVIEERCCAVDDKYCEFRIVPGEPNMMMEAEAGETEDFLTAEDKLKFAKSLEIISKNMYRSTLFNVVLRPGLGDYVHISVLQTALNGIKFADPFYSSLLYYAGLNYGKVSLNLGFQGIPDDPPEFEKGCQMIEDYFNDPTTILTRKQGKVKLRIIDEETAYIKIYDCATASGISTYFTETETLLCDFTAGFIDGRLTELLQENVRVEETACHGSINPDHEGDKFCEFKIMLD